MPALCFSSFPFKTRTSLYTVAMTAVFLAAKIEEQSQKNLLRFAKISPTNIWPLENISCTPPYRELLKVFNAVYYKRTEKAFKKLELGGPVGLVRPVADNPDKCSPPPKQFWSHWLLLYPCPIFILQRYTKYKTMVLKYERHILKELGFSLYNLMQHPHKYILVYTEVRVLVFNIIAAAAAIYVSKNHLACTSRPWKVIQHWHKRHGTSSTIGGCSTRHNHLHGC